jgi:KipI family sensor histidine kinase inhibitor
VHSVARAARERFGEALSDVVPGHRTVLLVWGETVNFSDALISDLEALEHSAGAFRSDTEHPEEANAPSLAIRVRYDGDDLTNVAGQLGTSVDELVALHCGGEYTVAFMGFAPGFPYLIESSGAEASGALLALPRLATPRTEVPAGSVAVAAGYCGVYPRSSPGGWNLIGRTDVVLFDPQREPPALLSPGSRVRFTPA